MIKFYDTCSLLLDIERLQETKEPFYISSITLEELENIKISSHKDLDVKYLARKTLRILNEPDAVNYTVLIYTDTLDEKIKSTGISVSNDSRIIISLKELIKGFKKEHFTFVSNDLCAKTIAKNIFSIDVESVEEESDDYVGYCEVWADAEYLASFYSDASDKKFDEVYTNTYLILRFEDGKIVDKLKWDGNKYIPLKYKDFHSSWFGKVKPMRDDVYQACAADSLANNQITLLRGKAGSGKSYLALGYLASAIENHQIDKIIIFCNPVATKDAARLGFYPGTKDDKLMDSQIGNFLVSKFGGRDFVQKLIAEEKIILLPMSDLRGFDTSGMRAGIYITEAQNMSVELMKLALQRIGEDCICIIDGDDKAQVDDINFSGANNGIKRMSKVFRGQDFYGEVTLQTIYRSKIAQIAELM